MNYGYYGVFDKPLSLFIRSFPLINSLPFGLGVYQWLTSTDLILGLYICRIYLLAVVYILHRCIYMYMYVTYISQVYIKVYLANI